MSHFFLPPHKNICPCSQTYLHLWKGLQVFHFYDESLYLFVQLEMLKTFTIFRKVLLALSKYRNIRKMGLSCAYSLFDMLYPLSTDKWICIVIGPFLVELNLQFSLQWRPILLPLSLFAWPDRKSVV